MLSFLLTISLYCDHVPAANKKLECFNRHLHCLEFKGKPIKGCVIPKFKKEKK